MKHSCPLEWFPKQLICILLSIVHHPSTKGMSNKDRLAMLIFTNANDSLKVAVTIMGNLKNPQGFIIEEPSLYYVLVEKAWDYKRTS